MTNEEFIKCVQLEMGDLASKGVTNIGDQFAIWFAINILGEAEGETIEQFHIGGPSDHKIDLGINNEDHSSIIVAQCKFCKDPSNKTFSVDLPEEAKNAVDRLKSMPESGNEKRKAFAEKFNGSDKPVRVLAAGFGSFSEDAYKYAKNNKIEIYDFNKIKKRYIYNDTMENFKTPDAVAFKIDINNCIKQDVSDLGLKQWIFLHKARDVYKFVKEFGDGIFQSNLRFRLMDSAKSGIGRDIYNTIIGDESKAFSILNNGLTIVASRVEEAGGKLTILSPQIVNGCQSSWAIYDAIEHLIKSGNNIEDIETTVLVKLVETSEDELTSKITQSTNRQNTIDDRDVHSKDDVQLEIASEFKNYDPPIFYDYKAGHWESMARANQAHIFRISGKKYRKISNTLCGQIYLAMLNKPFYSKQFKQKIFKDSD